MKSTVLNEQFQFAKLGLAEERKFLVAIEQETCPERMETICENLLRTTICDSDLETNQGNTTDVLPTL